MSAHKLVEIVRAVAVTTAAVSLSVKSAAVSLAASPSPGTVPPIDPRSGGEPPGFAGGPVEVLLLIVLLGVVTAVATFLVIRLTGTGGDT